MWPTISWPSPWSRAMPDRTKDRPHEALAAPSPVEKAVVIDSGTLDTEGVNEVSRLFRVEADELGFEYRVPKR